MEPSFMGCKWIVQKTDILKIYSMDHISRLLVDVHINSSMIMDNILTNYQRSLMNCLYNDNTNRRPKYNIIMCKKLDPMMTANKYLDGSDYENEIKQVIGETYAAFDIGDGSLIFFGRDGLLVAGSRIHQHHDLFVTYLSLKTRQVT